MKTQELLKQMEEHVFQAYFYEEVCAGVERRMAEGKYGDVGRLYQQSIEELGKQLSGKEELLHAFEEVSQQLRHASAKQGFVVGVYCGFKQCLTDCRKADGGFYHYITEMTDRRQTAPERKRQQELYQKLMNNSLETTQKHLETVYDYWEEAIHATAIHGFYCGYRAAQAITDAVAFGEGDYMDRLSKQLTVEYAFGYIRSYAQTENAAERELPDRAEDATN